MATIEEWTRKTREAIVATARREGFVAGAEGMKDQCLQVVKDLWQQTIDWKEKDVPAKGRESEHYEHWNGRLITRSIIEQRIRALPIEGEDTRTDLFQECRTLAESARRDLQLVGIGGDSSANLESAKEAMDALLARLPEENPHREETMRRHDA